MLLNVVTIFNKINRQYHFNNYFQVYFEYLQTSFHLMQKSKQASFSLKNIAEEEWDFAKEICPYISGAEARAGFKFW